MVNITRQSPILSLLTLVIISIVSMLNIPRVEMDSIGVGGLYGALLSFQANYYIMSLVVSGFLVIFTGFNIARLSVKYSLFAGHSSLAMPLYGLFACGFVFVDDYLVAYLSSFLLVLTVKYYCSGYRLNSYGFSSIFHGSIILGLMPYIYPASISLILILPFIVLIFKRSLREMVVAIGGVVLPSLIISYILWLRGDGVLSHVLMIIESLKLDYNAVAQLNNMVSAYVIFGTYISLVVIAYLCYLKDRYQSTKKARRITIFNMYLALCCVVVLIIPSSTTAVMALLAIPTSILIPIVLIRMDALIAMVTYLTLMTLWLLSLVC